MNEVEVKIRFRAGHRLIPPYKGHCNNPHGEGYTVILFFKKAELDENGMVFDFGRIKKHIKSWIDENWDHSYIHHKDDEVGEYLFSKGFKTFNIGNKNPTAENMAKYLFDIIKQDNIYISKIGIIESFEDSIAWYEG